MAINLNNYERFIIDYLDDNLDAVQVAELLYFISDHPELEINPDDLEKIKLYTLANTAIFPGKESLKKDFSKIETITSANAEEFVIAQLEGDLDEKTEQKFELYKKFHPEIKKQEALYKKTILSPDENIQYSHKNSLKKPVLSQTRIRKIVFYIPTAAAVLILLLFLYNPIKEIIAPGAETSIVQNSPENTQNSNVRQPEQDNNTIEQKSPGTSSGLLADNSYKDKKTGKTSNQQEVKFYNQLSEHEKIVLHKLTPKDVIIPSTIPQTTNILISAANVQTKKGQNPVEDATSLLALENTIGKKISGVKDINMWKAIRIGVNGLNELTESDLSLETKTNKEGKVTAFAITGDNFRIVHETK